MTADRNVSPPVAEAFARPADVSETLQRPPAKVVVRSAEPESNPWRDPRADVLLGAPADPLPDRAEPERGAVPALTLREALLHRRLRPGTLIGMAAIALAIGVVGALIGALLAPRSATLPASSQVTLATAQPAVERPAGSVAEIAARVLPAVVSIDVRVDAGGETGSGIVISADGYVLTNNHVISMAVTDTADISVRFDDGAATRVPARLIGQDPATDLAVLKVDGVNGLTVAQLGDSDALAVGDTVLAVGSPLGLSGTVTSGIVSAVHRPVRLGAIGTDADAVIDAIQTDAAVNPGNSGGPLVDITGAVIGINTAIRTLSTDPTTGGSIGLGFAIPINTARSVAESLMSDGFVRHPTIGVNVRTVTDGALTGAQVQNVVDGGPAQQAGILEGDVIVAVGERSVRTADEMAVAVSMLPIGESVPVTVLRSGRTMSVSVTLGST